MNRESQPMDDFASAEQAAQLVLSKTRLRPRIGLVLGSGLGAFAESLSSATRIPFSEIPHFPASTAPGHAGQMVVGEVDGIPLAVMQGRVHFYEGYSPQQVVYPVRVLSRMGIKALILTNAAGGISSELKQGGLVVLSDHINLQGSNPLMGRNDDRLGLRFFDMTHAYDPAYRALALAAGKRLGISVSEGIYVAVSGPSYETPAEIRAFRTLGADVVGMSTVPEVIASVHLGIKVLAISCVTNLAAGISQQPLSHEEVLQVGERVKGDFMALITAVLPGMAESVGGSLVSSDQ